MRPSCLKLYFVFTLTQLLSLSISLSAQTISGQIIDEKGNGIAYASLFIREISLGVAANEEGRFNIKVTPGEYNLVFQSLGFNPESRNVRVVEQNINLNVALSVRHYDLDAVTFSLRAEDPAYGIMRKAIGLAPYHSNQVKSYNAHVYIKGKVNVMKLSRIVKRMLRKEEDAPKEGEIYVHESNNELNFTAPNKYEQKVLSLRNTFPGTDSNDPMQFISLNLYQPTFGDWLKLPLAPSAFTHYRFKYLGASSESDRLIHKIEVIPKRKSQQFVSGTLYIVDDLYCIHSADLKGEFIGGNFRFKSQFAELNGNLWMPVSHNIGLEIKVMGNSAEINYLASVSYKNLVSNDAYTPSFAEVKTEKQKPTTKPPTPKQKKQQQQIDAILQKDELSNRDMQRLSRLTSNQQKVDTVKSLEIKSPNKVSVDSMATKRDSSYWEELRPIPLSVDEIKSFQQKDSLIRLTAPDSLRKKAVPNYLRKRSLARVAFTGGRFGSKESTWSFSTQGISLNSFSFNTVDGIVPSYSFSIGKRFKNRSLSLNQNYSYAISRETLSYSLALQFLYSPSRRASASLGFGSQAKDFNVYDGVEPMVNSLTTLLLRENHLKLFEEKWVSLANTIDLANGLVLRTSAKAFSRNTLSNTNDFSFFYRDTKQFTPNIPINGLYEQSTKLVVFGGMLNVNLSYTPYYYYRMYGTTKRMIRSDYPTFWVGYKLNSYFLQESIFSHQVSLKVFQQKNWGLFQEFHYSLGIGMFLGDKNIHFADFKHFNTQPVPVVFKGVSASFCNLPFYTQSTSTQWAELHTSYRSAFLLLKFLPLISQLNFKEAVFFSALSTGETPYYLEAGYGFCEILQSIRLSGHVGYMHAQTFSFGFRFGVDL